MTLAGILFLALSPTISIAPPAPALDLCRIAGCIEEIEATKWSAPGGALGFQRPAWDEDGGGLPYRCACEPAYSRDAAVRRLRRFSAWLEDHNYTVTPQRLGQAWRHGLSGSVRTVYYNTPLKDADYGERVSNLYFDKKFKLSKLWTR